jgi:hypothetical protein
MQLLFQTGSKIQLSTVCYSLHFCASGFPVFAALFVHNIDHRHQYKLYAFKTFVTMNPIGSHWVMLTGVFKQCAQKN